MTFPPDGAARSLCLAADEALTAAAFCTGDFAEADRHLGFYYFAADPRPQEAMRQLGHSLPLREKLGGARRVPSAPGRAGRGGASREANLLPWRIRDAEQNLREAEAITRSTG